MTISSTPTNANVGKSSKFSLSASEVWHISEPVGMPVGWKGQRSEARSEVRRAQTKFFGAQVSTIHPDEIERDKLLPRTPSKEVIKLRPAWVFVAKTS